MSYQADTYLSSGSNVLKILEYTSSGNTYGINILKVSRVLNRVQGFRSLVKANPCVRGAFTDHNIVIPLVDLSMFLGGEPTLMDQRFSVIICEFFGVLNGLLVDRVEAVHTLLWENVINAGDVLEASENRYVISIVQPSEDKMILLLDYETILLELTPEQSEKEKEKLKGLEISAAGQTVLVADDSPPIRNMLKQELADAGFKVFTARDGKNAWEILQRENVDLVISDVEMPQMDGLALTKTIREEYENRDLPVIVYSSIGDMGMKERARFLQAEHITKLNMDELFAKVNDLIKK